MVTNKDIAEQIVVSIAERLNSQLTFGNGFSTTYRKAPSLRILNSYIVMFDASQ